jgi:PDZ domain-containing protein
VSKPHDEVTAERPPQAPGEPIGNSRRTGRRLTRRGWTLLISGVLFVVFLVLGLTVPVPYVSISPGPTFDTLGKDQSGAPVIQISGHQEFPTTGQLRMTTVSLRDDISLFTALGLWASSSDALAPRDEYFPPGQSSDQVAQENVKAFKDSQSNAEVAALSHLHYPVKVLANDVVGNSPADHVLAPGDQILMVNGKKVTGEDDVRAALTGTKAGQTISITFVHGTQPPTTKSLTLAKRPDASPEGFIGLTPIDRADVPFDVKISLQDIGGPSAGLMFTLAIVDRMTGQDLAGGRHIAGTGEITEKGVVGPIGGISFKVIGARDAGATDFLVPQQNCAEAKSADPAGLNLIKVSSLDTALTALADLKAGRPTPSC